MQLDLSLQFIRWWRRAMIPKDYPMTVFSLTGYSGGGKKMIAEYESPEKPQSYFAPRIYGLTLKHKHLPEMQKVCGLDLSAGL